MGVPQKNFMTLDEMRHEVLRGNALDSELLNARIRGEILEPTVSQDIERAHAFGKFINRAEKFLVLRLEGDVKLKKIGTFYVPVGKMSLRHERVGISQNGLETFDYFVRFLFGRCLCAHARSMLALLAALRNPTFFCWVLPWQRRFAIGPEATLKSTQTNSWSLFENLASIAASAREWQITRKCSANLGLGRTTRPRRRVKETTLTSERMRQSEE